MTKATGRPRGRPPVAGERLGRLYVNVPAPLIAALAEEAGARGVSVSELVRDILAAWHARQPADNEPQSAIERDDEAEAGDREGQS